MLSPLYMAEISPPEVRGSLMALEQFAIVLGAVLGFWAGFFTRNSASSIYAQPPSVTKVYQSRVRRLGEYLWVSNSSQVYSWA